jgi:hypothetical protein
MRHLKRVTSNLNPTQACISRTISVSRDTRLRVSFSVFDWTPVGGRRNFGGIAQLVEHVLCKHEVTGSNPVASRLCFRLGEPRSAASTGISGSDQTERSESVVRACSSVG